MATTLGNGIFTLQEFYNRGVTKLAPDVLVYIGGSLTTQVLAPVSKLGNGDLTFDDGITSVSIQNTTDPPGSSTANIEINTPIYGPNSKYWVPYPDPLNAGAPIKAPLFIPMMEVKIYFKGRYLVKGQPQYYPAFWGLISTIEETYSGGMYKILLGCVDMLHWWAYSTINVHPVPESRIMSGGGQDLTVYATIFRTNNPYNILYTLTTSMGMHEFVTASWVAQKTGQSTIYPPKLFQFVTKGIMQYWRQRFANIGNLLKMYGIFGQRVDHNGVQLRVPENTPPDTSKKSEVSKAKQPKDTKQYKVDREYLRDFQVFFDFDKMGTFEKAEYMTKLDIATELKNRCNFEFFQDTNGNFMFKPPFYNLNVKGMLPYTILPSDIISYSMSTNTEEIITVLEVTTPMHKNLRTQPFDQGIGFHMDIDLTQRYGIRHKIIPMEFVQDARMARSLAVGQMNINNAKAVTGSITIPGRPEMRLGYPVYIEHKDAFHYVKSIGHSFEYAGSFSTTLALETERRRVRDLPESNSTGVQLNTTPNQGGTSSGLVNAIPNNLVSSSILNYGWSEPLKDKVYRYKEPKIPNIKSNPNDPPQITVSDTTRQNLLMGEFKISSMQQGRYEITDRNKDSDSELAITQTTVPFTDEDGFQVVGSFPYGRNLNPICISQETVGPPILKDVYLVTMARPVYESESKAMSVLFFDDKEGAVPDYLQGFNIGSQTPTDIATKPETDAVLTLDQAKQTVKPVPVTVEQTANLTFAKPPQGQ